MLVAAAALMLAAAGPAAAQTPFKDIASGGPLTHVYLGNELSCQVAHAGDAVEELYPPGVIPGDCGTFIATGGSLYGPDFANHGTTATGFSSGYTPFAPVSQSAVTGAGTAANPFKVVTVATAAPGLTLTETDTYISGQESYRTDVSVANSQATQRTAILYRAGDCFLQESDDGYGFIETGRGAVGCSVNPNNTPADRIEEWVPITGGNKYLETTYSGVWSAINTQTAFANTCLCTDLIDNGAGISWSITVPPSGSVTRSHLTVFSPEGTTGKVSARGTFSDTTGGAVQMSAANDCSPSQSTRGFQVRWTGGGSFTKTSITSSTCSADATLPTGVAGFNKQVGTAAGTLNGGGTGTISWTFKDGGPGGVAADKVSFIVRNAANAIVKQVNEQSAAALSGTPGGVWTFAP